MKFPLSVVEADHGGQEMGNNLLKVIYYAIAVLCVMISSYLSFFGFLSLTGNVTIPLVAVLALGLIGADIVIQQKRSTNGSLALPLACFVGFAMFSMSSNFNHVYSSFMKRDAVVGALSAQLDVFRSDLVNTRTVLEEDARVRAITQDDVELNRELDRLRLQVLDPLRPGCGPRCRGHLTNIERILGKPLTDNAVPAPGQPVEVYEDWLNRTKEAIETDWQEIRLRGQAGPAMSVMDEIDLGLEIFSASPNEIADTRGLSALQEMADTSSSIERGANAVLQTEIPIEHTPIDASQGRLGEIAYTFQNAFVQMPNPLVTFMAAVISMIVDVFPLIFAFMAFSPRDGRRGAPPTTGRGRIPMD